VEIYELADSPLLEEALGSGGTWLLENKGLDRQAADSCACRVSFNLDVRGNVYFLAFEIFLN
jgi:hypothetical protein